jgi:hypothetical protein
VRELWTRRADLDHFAMGFFLRIFAYLIILSVAPLLCLLSGPASVNDAFLSVKGRCSTSQNDSTEVSVYFCVSKNGRAQIEARNTITYRVLQNAPVLQNDF